MASTAAELPGFDLTRAGTVAEWHATHHVGPLEADAEGLKIRIVGHDPYINGPARDYPADTPLWLNLTIKSEVGGAGQVFYFRQTPTEENSARFPVKAGDWQAVKVRLPALGSAFHLRIDPPGQSGACWIKSLTFEPRVVFEAPEWPTVEMVDPGSDALVLESGDLRLSHAPDRFNGFVIEVAGRRLASGNPRQLIGYEKDGGVRWVELASGGQQPAFVTLQPRTQLSDRWIGGSLSSRVTFTDPDGGTWEAEQIFKPDVPGAIRVSVRLRPEPAREVLHLPVFTLFAGLGSFGTNKTQALLPGIEYLANEPGSSTADLNEPASWRQVPDMMKLTFPLMALAAEERWIGLTWSARPDPETGVFFDTPDRLFHSGGSVMGILFPSSDGMNREENSLIPYGPQRLRGSLRWEGLILGGRGDSVVPAVQRYVELGPLPARPDIGMSATDYYRLAARGWLDSKGREGNRYRHAAWPGFNPAPAADAAVWMEWLAARVNDDALAEGLREAAKDAIALVPPGDRLRAQVGHIRPPLPPLVFGGVAESARQSAAQARALFRRFEPDGAVLYQASRDRPDYGRTHWAQDANGLTAQVVHTLLANAAFCGDADMIDEGVQRLRALDKFRDTVPRGAQTWEIPLHTPDILASAHLVDAYVLGYELTGEEPFLEQARYWAWTGVPFVYLTPPVAGPVGVYSTIAVLGATGWVAPVWIGLPVQWCGLVYADALRRLARHDDSGPWLELAEGIALTGIQHTHPADTPELAGLLPDSFALRGQSRDGPAINPATTLVPAIPALGEDVPYDLAVARRHGWRIHAPGPILNLEESDQGVSFRVDGWPEKPWHVLINGVKEPVEISLDGRPATADQAEFHAQEGWVVLTLAKPAAIVLRRTGAK